MESKKLLFFFFRSTLQKGVVGEPLELSLLQVEEAYRDLAVTDKPMIAWMSIQEKTLVQTRLGLAQRGSLLSYQQPLLSSKTINVHPDAPPYPLLPLEEHRLAPTACVHVCTEEEQFHLRSLKVTFPIARNIETSTREQAEDQQWHQLRHVRVTSSRFREVCFVLDRNAEGLAERMLKGTRQTADMKRGREMEFIAATEYCKLRNISYTPVGLVIHPDAPWLGSSPDGLVYDPTTQPPFGLVEFKSPNVKNYVDCSYLKMKDGSLVLPESHMYYWQVQGQLLLTGLQWCDFVVFAQEDMLVQRIHVDPTTTATIRKKADWFYYYVYMPKYLAFKKR